MKFESKSRKYFNFNIDENWEFIQDGIIAKDGILKFAIDKERNQDTRTFENEEQCIEWYNQYKDMNMDRLAKSQDIISIKAVEMTDDIWNKILKHLPANSKKKQSDFRIYNDYLAFNLPDRQKERFPVDVLMRLKQTIVGKPKLMAHSWMGTDYGKSAWIGKYFDSEIIDQNYDEVIAMLGDSIPSESYKRSIKKVIEIEGSVKWLVAPFYVSTVKTEAIDDLDSGLPGSSIGIVGARTKEFVDESTGDLLWYEYILLPNTEATEGSMVGVEAQRGAGTKSLNTQTPEIEQLGGSQMKCKIELKSLGLSKEVDAENIVEDFNEIQKSVDEKVKSMNDEFEVQKKTLTDQLETANSVLKVFGEKVTVEIAESIVKLAEAGKKAKAAVINEIVKLSVDMKLLEKDEAKVKAKKESLESQDYDSLISDLEPLKVKWAEEHPADGTLHTGDDEPEKKAVPVEEILPQTRFEM